MMHDLIFALNAFPGDIFIYEDAEFKIQVDKVDLKLPLLHSSEWAILKEILEVGTYYKQISEFVKSFTKIQVNLGFLSASDNNELSSAIPNAPRTYLSAICHGIQSVIKSYTDVIADLEYKVLNDPFITFTHVRSTCEPFRELFRLLLSFINQIKGENSSCLLIEILKKVYDGNIHYQDVLLPIVTQVHVPFRRHITNWVVFGSLPPNPNTEFFIQLCKDDPEEKETPKQTGRFHKKQFDRYFVNYALVPLHFSLQLVERILFMGNSVLILEKSEKTKLGLAEKQKEFLAKMNMLPTNTFRTDDLSDTMEVLASAVGKDLYHLVVKEANLLQHLNIIKEFYLTGRGELFYDFLCGISENLAKKTAMMDLKMLQLRNIRLDIKECFQLSARRIQLNEDIFQKIEIVVVTDDTKTDLIDKYLSGIRFNLKQEWPLHILFTTESMNGYNEIFRFLLQIRRVQMQLKSIWVETKHIFRVPIPNGPAILRIHMTYFINNFQYYLQADVLESQYALLLESIEKSDTFDQIKISLARFQSNIMVQSFRTNSLLRDGIEKMLELCGNFCNHMEYLIQEFQDNGVPVCEGSSPVVDKFTSEFHRRVEYLYSSFRRLAGDPQFGAYLGQLLLRLDYNSYFSKYLSMSGLEHPSLGKA